MTRRREPLTVLVLGAWIASSTGSCASGTATGRLGQADFAKQFETNRSKAQDLEYEGLISTLSINPSEDGQLQFDPTSFRYFAEAGQALGLLDNEKIAFKRNGFAAVDRGVPMSMAQTYLEIYKADLPVFVTADSILHALHRSYDKILMEDEEYVLIPNMKVALATIENGLKPWLHEPDLSESANDLGFFIAVTRNLLDGVEPDAAAKRAFPLASGGTPALSDVLAKIGRFQPDRDGNSQTSLFGRARIVDWSQFRPRGHYVQSRGLSAYFRAMMWLGRADLAWDLNRDRELRAAGLLALLIRESGQSKRLAAMNQLLEFMVGRADSSGIADIESALSMARIEKPRGLLSSDDLARLRAALMAIRPTEQQIRSEPSWEKSVSRTVLASTFQLFGQRFLPDAFVLSKVVSDSIIYHERKQDRRMPTGLDIAAALGSDEAIRELEPQVRTYNYAANLLAGRQLFDGLSKVEWQRNVYIRWLDALRQLLRPSDMERLPRVFRSREWKRKELQTTLASWAELRHDTLLYGKQSYSGSITCEYPEGYVEPYPDFYGVLGRLAMHAAALLGANELDLPEAPLTERGRYLRRDHSKFFLAFGKTMERLQSIALKQLQACPLDAEERDFLKDIIIEHAASRGCGGIGTPKSYTGWYERLHYGGGSMESHPTVTDIHTDSDAGLFLEEGVGYARFVVVAIDSPKNRAVYVGPIYSYYEFTSATRLTDAEWEMRVSASPPPPAPFTDGFVLPPAKRTLVYPHKASQPIVPLEPTTPPQSVEQPEEMLQIPEP